MGFLDRLRGIPETVGAPPVAPTPRPGSPVREGATHIGRQFDLGSLPQPDHDVHMAVEAGELLSAIKAYRFQSGSGLAEAKNVIDAMVRGDRLVSRVVEYDVEDPAFAAKRVADAEAQIDAFIAAGQKIAAIKVHRELHGLGLKESKDAVEARTEVLRRGGA